MSDLKASTSNPVTKALINVLAKSLGSQQFLDVSQVYATPDGDTALVLINGHVVWAIWLDDEDNYQSCPYFGSLDALAAPARIPAYVRHVEER